MSLIYFGTGLTVWFAMCNWGALQETTTCGVSSPPHWRKNAHFRSINQTKMHSVLPFCLFICFVELFIVLDLVNVFTLSSVHIYKCQLLINVCIYIGVPPLPSWNVPMFTSPSPGQILFVHTYTQEPAISLKPWSYTSYSTALILRAGWF